MSRLAFDELTRDERADARVEALGWLASLLGPDALRAQAKRVDGRFDHVAALFRDLADCVEQSRASIEAS